jgi:hypothetical protein
VCAAPLLLLEPIIKVVPVLVIGPKNKQPIKCALPITVVGVLNVQLLNITVTFSCTTTSPANFRLLIFVSLSKVAFLKITSPKALIVVLGFFVVRLPYSPVITAKLFSWFLTSASLIESPS